MFSPPAERSSSFKLFGSKDKGDKAQLQAELTSPSTSFKLVGSSKGGDKAGEFTAHSSISKNASFTNMKSASSFSKASLMKQSMSLFGGGNKGKDKDSKGTAVEELRSKSYKKQGSPLMSIISKASSFTAASSNLTPRSLSVAEKKVQQHGGEGEVGGEASKEASWREGLGAKLKNLAMGAKGGEHSPVRVCILLCLFKPCVCICAMDAHIGSLSPHCSELIPVKHPPLAPPFL